MKEYLHITKIRHMSYRVSLTVVLISLCSLLAVETIDAQIRTRSRDRDDNETRRYRDMPKEEFGTWYGFSLGTLGFGSSFSISGKFKYGLQYNERFSVGLSAKGFYDLVNVINAPDIGLFSYGGAAFTRVKITDDIYLHGEYGYTDFEGATNAGTQFRESILYPSVGGGYLAGYGDWTYGFHVLLPLNDRARDFVSLEYWIDFVHKF